MRKIFLSVYTIIFFALFTPDLPATNNVYEPGTFNDIIKLYRNFYEDTTFRLFTYCFSYSGSFSPYFYEIWPDNSTPLNANYTSDYPLYSIQPGFKLYWEPIKLDDSKISLFYIENNLYLNPNKPFETVLEGNGKLITGLRYIKNNLFDINLGIFISHGEYVNYLRGISGKFSNDLYHLHEIYSDGTNIFGNININNSGIIVNMGSCEQFRLAEIWYLFDLPFITGEIGPEFQYLPFFYKSKLGFVLKELELPGKIILNGEVFANDYYNVPRIEFSHAMISVLFPLVGDVSKKNNFTLCLGASGVYTGDILHGVLGMSADIVLANIPSLSFISNRAFFDVNLGVAYNRLDMTYTDNSYYFRDAPFFYMGLKALHYDSLQNQDVDNWAESMNNESIRKTIIDLSISALTGVIIGVLVISIFDRINENRTDNHFDSSGIGGVSGVIAGGATFTILSWGTEDKKTKSK